MANKNQRETARLSLTSRTLLFVCLISLGFVLGMGPYLFLLFLDIAILVMFVFVVHGGHRRWWGGVVLPLALEWCVLLPQSAVSATVSEPGAGPAAFAITACMQQLQRSFIIIPHPLLPSDAVDVRQTI